MNVNKLRSGLSYTREAIKRGKLTIGYLGGSITDGREGYNWSQYFSNWISARFPDTQIIVENAAKGATGSNFAVMRVEKQIIEKECDLVFIEYAVNDSEMDPTYRFEAREGLIRKLLRYGKCDIILVYTYNKLMRDPLLNGEVPASVRDFEILAQHYNISSVWPGLKAFEGWRKGLYQYYEWLPDGLHPQIFGSNIYSNCVAEFFEMAYEETSEREESIPEALYEHNWENLTLMNLEDLKIDGIGTLYRPYHTIPVGLSFQTRCIDTKISFDFYGTGCLVVHMVGKDSYSMAYRVDGGERVEKHDSKADWNGKLGHFSLKTVADKLNRGNHHVEIEPVFSNSPAGLGSVFELSFVAIIP